MSRDIDALNDEITAAGARIFVGGLSPARSARSLRAQPAGKALVTDWPYIETNRNASIDEITIHDVLALRRYECRARAQAMARFLNSG